jgi:predicted DNA-binding transcriptional regulator AlpA
MIMALQAGDRLLSLTDLSEMLGVPVHTLYRWRYKATAPSAIGWAATCGAAAI